jgi:hypothetical protein
MNGDYSTLSEIKIREVMYLSIGKVAGVLFLHFGLAEVKKA